MRNKTLLAFAIAASIATPLSFAQGRGAGGPPAGVGAIGGNAGARISDRAAIGIDTASRAATQRTVDRDARTRFGAEQKSTVQAAQNQTAVDAKLKTDVEAEVGTQANTNATFGQDTAVRAKLQQDADVETRSTFGTTQSATAKAKNDTAVDVDDSTDD
jgi:hypothetical protein